MDFAQLPGLIARELQERRRVVVVLLDAFGWAFAQRHARHPLLSLMARDGSLAPMASQFPSTTTAHVTTMHTGLPVGDHGLYEWRVWEPSLGRVIVPLTIDEDGFDPRALLPDGPSFYQRLAARGIPSLVYSPARFSPSAYDRAAIRGAPLFPYDSLADGLALLTAAVAERDACYAYLYWDQVDAIGHRFGPSSPEFDDACLRALDAVYAAFFGPEAPALADTLLMITADHGQIDVSPDRITYITTDAPLAGSARDAFVTVAPEDIDSTIAALNALLGDAGTAVPTTTLFPSPGPRLSARLAPICILPAPGHMVWTRDPNDIQLHFRGHHGGRTPEESTTFLGTLELG
jgi:hypothetical protein